MTFISLPLMLGLVAFLAGLFPALKASRIDPLEALRVDWTISDLRSRIADYSGFTIGD